MPGGMPGGLEELWEMDYARYEEAIEKYYGGYQNGYLVIDDGVLRLVPQKYIKELTIQYPYGSFSANELSYSEVEYAGKMIRMLLVQHFAPKFRTFKLILVPEAQYERTNGRFFKYRKTKRTIPFMFGILDR